MKRLGIVAVVLVLVVVTASACGGGEEEPPASIPLTATIAPPAGTAATPTPVEPGRAPVVFRGGDELRPFHVDAQRFEVAWTFEPEAAPDPDYSVHIRIRRLEESPAQDAKPPELAQSSIACDAPDYPSYIDVGSEPQSGYKGCSGGPSWFRMELWWAETEGEIERDYNYTIRITPLAD